MNVAELIEELKKMPQHYPVVCDVGARVDESIYGAFSAESNMGSRVGPVVRIYTVTDPRNDPDWDPCA